ncbi:PTS sugar transporter subunit IIA [Terrisporobacter petrolearius]|uniref:BglG family transcription antiterminator n=1 Tax=Terrisporobacter petrolearius TaxID=1460447 RepID=UPI001D15E752|nr:PTS sugar transporter subunit IIA [Terrisporobacter petrolearius]MCC3865003.1 PTS sugar transporter subunit IIA [Terrisporobacter petrolearius]
MMRILNIINDLVDANKYLSIGYFMDRYSVSKRTVQNDFSYLTNISKKKGFSLNQKRGSGYLLEIENQLIFNNFIKELKQVSNQPKLNVENIIAFIALNENYITIDNLIEQLQSSRSVIKGHMKETNNYLKQYNLTLERKAHYGIKICNGMKERRNLLVELYTNENEIIKKHIDSVVENDFKNVEDELINELKEKNLVINYMELKEILSWLKITIYINEKFIELDENNNDLGKVEGSNIKLFESDKEDLISLIKSKTRKKVKRSETIDNLSKNLEYFLTEFDENNNTFFNHDNEFKKSLLNHVSSLLERSAFSISYKNPIIDEIQIKYPVAFNIAILLGKMLNSKYQVDINRDEIGFIATHFAMNMEKQLVYKFKKYNSIAIVCSSGGGSAQLIKFKISGLFKNTEIRTFSILQVKEMEDFNPDIIFSICEIDTNLKVPVIYIKELLDDYDILRIKELVMFENFNQSLIQEKKTAFISKFFNIDYFDIDEKSLDYMKCLEQTSKDIEEDKIGGSNYSKYVLKREGFSSTIYLNGVAIPHPIEMNGNENLVAVKVLKKPIEFEGKKVSIIFMVCLKKESLELHKKITNDLYEVMSDVETVQLLTKVKTFKEFVAIINERI